MRGLKKSLLILIALGALISAGCATTWIVDADSQVKQLQWPQSPNKAKVLYVSAIKGFKETGTSFSSVMKSIFFGRGGDGRIVRPLAVATGNDGRIAIADTGARCVHLYVQKEQKYVKILGSKAEQLESPVGVAFDEDARLYVSDSTLDKILVFDSRGEPLSTIGGSAEQTYLKRPAGLAYDVDNKVLFVADTYTHEIHVIDRDGKLLFSFGKRGDGSGQFNFPTYLFRSPNGPIYVTDSLNFRVQVFSAFGKHLYTFGRHGDGSGDFAMPKGIAVDKDGVIYVADSLFDAVQLFSERGTFLLTVGSQGGGEGEFWMPSGIFIDHNNKLYVCDTYNQRVQIFQLVEKSYEYE
jgi:DNA-binding beta-propeller fold protein YncE